MSLTTNLVSYWKMDEGSDTDRADAHGSNTLTSHGVNFDTGKLGNAGAFQAGASDYLSVATNASLEFTTAFSIQVWAFTDTSFAPSATFASKWLYSTDGGWTFSMDGAGSQLRMWVADAANDPGGNVIDSTGVSLGINTWFHIVAVYDGTQSTASDRVKFYVNGSPTGTSVLAGTIPSSLQNSGADFNISYWPGLNRFFDGRLDEIALWSRALSSSEVAQLYNSGNALAYPFANSYTMTADVGTFTLTGEDAGLKAGRKLTAGQGSFTLTGQDASFARTRVLVAGTAHFTLTGFAANFSGQLTAPRSVVNVSRETRTLAMSGESRTSPVAEDSRVH